MLINIFLAYTAPALAQSAIPQTGVDASGKGYDYSKAGVSDTIKLFLCAPTEPGTVSTNNTGGTAATTGNTAANDLNECINKLYKFSIAIASVIAVFFIVIGGYIYMNAGGNQESVDKAKNILETSITALVILFGAYILLRGINPDLIKIPAVQPPTVQYAGGPLAYSDFGGYTPGNDIVAPADRKPNTTKEGCDYSSAAVASKHMVTFSVKTWDISGNTQTRNLTMNKEVESKVKAIFDAIYNNPLKFPINSLGGFNYNFVVSADGTKTLSGHACGLAIDINPAENPYIVNVQNVASSAWKPCPGANCSKYSIGADSPVVQAFKNNGFGWGGDFKSLKDYMHFSCIQNEYGSCPFLKD